MSQILTLFLTISLWCSSCLATNIQSYPSANLGLWPNVNITASYGEYVAAGGVVLSGLLALTVGLYFLDVWVTSQADKALFDYLPPEAYHQITSKFDPNFDLNALLQENQAPQDEAISVSDFIVHNYGESHRVPKYLGGGGSPADNYISATTAEEWYRNRFRRQAEEKEDEEKTEENGVNADGIGPLFSLQSNDGEGSQSVQKLTSALVGMVSGWVDYAYKFVNAAAETFADSSCQEQLICETYQRTESYWFWPHIAPLLSGFSTSFARATDVAETGHGCAGFYRDCSYLDTIFGTSNNATTSQNLEEN